MTKRASDARNLFIDNPYLAAVIALVTVLCGMLGLRALSIAQYPNVTPPEIVVSTTYPGADAVTLLSSVVEPLEREINGVPGMIYMKSTASNSGSVLITVSFKVGTPSEAATQAVQDRVDWANAALPAEVRAEGVTVKAQSGNILLAISLYSPDGTPDALFMGNYAEIELIDQLKRIPGVSDVQLFGGSDYAMRIWLDSNRMAGLGIASEDVIQALKTQNINVAAGAIGGAPSLPGQMFYCSVRTRGRLMTAAEFAAITVRAQSSGATVKLGEIATVELGKESYDTQCFINEMPSVMLLVFQRADANAIDISNRCRTLMEKNCGAFPAGMKYDIQYDSTNFIRDSIKDVIFTLGLAIALVAVVCYLFLQNWRMALAPVLAIPVSIAGSFAVLWLLGYSINLVTLFALILAIGIVVDDAIIVIENTSRLIEQEHLDPAAAARRSMKEITSAVMATTAVLLAMFVPICFLPGITGELFRQFGVTVSAAVLFSALNALTFTPALSATLLRGHVPEPARFFGPFNRGFEAVFNRYGRGVAKLLQYTTVLLAIYLLGCAGIYLWYSQRPAGFIPSEDQGYFFGNLQMAPGTPLVRTVEQTRTAAAIMKQIPGVSAMLAVPGYNVLNNAPSTGNALLIAILEPWKQRSHGGAATTSDGIRNRAERELLGALPEMFPMLFAPPPIPGIGMANGFDFMLEERSSVDARQLGEMLDLMLYEASQEPSLQNIFSTFNNSEPYQRIVIDRERALAMQISLSELDQTLATLQGSYYVNNFNRFGKLYKLLTSARADDRADAGQLLRLHVKNARGDMVPLAAVAHLETGAEAATLTRYNLRLAAEIQGEPAPGVSSGAAMKIMEQLADRLLPPNFTYEWTGMSFQAQTAHGEIGMVFLLAVGFIYLFLAALYQSWILPLTVILTIPAAAAGAVAALSAAGIANNLYTQIGLVLLFGMAAKTAILIVNFAHRRQLEGYSPREAALYAAKLRFRAVTMTTLAFVFGTLPLALATGPGAASQRSIGFTVLGGMTAGLLGALLLAPIFYALLGSWRNHALKRAAKIIVLTGMLALASGCYTPGGAGKLIDATTMAEAEANAFRGAAELLPRPGTRLSLAEAQSIALANNPDYLAAKYAITTARMRYYQALGSFSPTLSTGAAVGEQLYSGNGSANGISNVGYVYATVQANWLIFDGLSREFAVLAAKHSHRSSELLDANARRLLLQAVSTAYCERQSLEARCAIASANAEFQRFQLRQAERKFAVGEISKSDVLNFAGQLNQAEMSLVTLEGELTSNLFTLANLLGYPEGALSEDLEFDTPDAEAYPVEMNVDGYLDLAIANRPDLNAARELLAVLRYTLYQNYSAYSPAVSTFANYSYSSANSLNNSSAASASYGNFFLSGNYFNYGISASMDLFSGFIRYNSIRAARAEVDRGYLEASRQWLNTVREVRDAYNQVRTRQRLRTLARRNRAILREERDLVAKEYAIGEVDIDRLNAAQNNFIRGEHEFISTEIGSIQAAIALYAAAALPLDAVQPAAAH